MDSVSPILWSRLMCAVCIVSESVLLCFRGHQTVVCDPTFKGDYKMVIGTNFWTIERSCHWKQLLENLEKKTIRNDILCPLPWEVLVFLWEFSVCECVCLFVCLYFLCYFDDFHFFMFVSFVLFWFVCLLGRCLCFL